MAAAIQVSRHHLARMASHAASLKRRLHSVSGKAEKAFDTGMTAAVTVGTAAALGYMHGRHGAVEVLGAPIELVGGVVLTGAALFGVGGKFHRQMAAAGNGALAVYGYAMAKGAGLNMKSKAEDKLASKNPTTTGVLPSDRLSREEMATMREPISAQR